MCLNYDHVRRLVPELRNHAYAYLNSSFFEFAYPNFKIVANFSLDEDDISQTVNNAEVDDESIPCQQKCL